LYRGRLKKIVIVANSAKNMIKLSPLFDQFSRYYDFFEPILLYTGKPFGKSESFYLHEELNLPRPHQFLNIKNGAPAETTGAVMLESSRYFDEISPDLVIVIGGSDAALGTAISAARKGIPIAHIEAGLRCPGCLSNTDINRKLIDGITNLFFVTDCGAHSNALAEGGDEKATFFVGNIMVDSLKKYLPIAAKSTLAQKLGLIPKGYAILSIHRRANTTSYDHFKGIISAAHRISEKIPVVFVCHRRVREEIDKFGLSGYLRDKRLIVAELSRYPDFLAIEKEALFSMTDSGTMQVESSVFGIPCLTLRTNTEWTATVTEGTNTIVGPFAEKITATAELILAKKYKSGGVPKYWDGLTAQRIVDVIAKWFPREEQTARKVRIRKFSD